MTDQNQAEAREVILNGWYEFSQRYGIATPGDVADAIIAALADAGFRIVPVEKRERKIQSGEAVDWVGHPERGTGTVVRTWGKKAWVRFPVGHPEFVPKAELTFADTAEPHG